MTFPTKVSFGVTFIMLLQSFWHCQVRGDGSEEFDNFVNNFQGCTVQLHYYKNIHLHITSTPVTIHRSKSFKLKQDLVTRKPCLARFYILPTISRVKDSGRQKIGQNGKALWGKGSGLRYDILLSQDDRVLKKWEAEQSKLYQRETLSHGLMMNVNEITDFWHDTLRVDTKVYIVKKLQLANGRLVAPSVDLARIRLIGLNKVIDEVNDLQRNADVEWDISSLGMQRAERDISRNLWIKMQNGSWNLTDLVPWNVFSERLENYAFAYMALGSNISLVLETDQPDARRKPPASKPTIIFGVGKGKYMQEPKPRSLGFISCASNPHSRAEARSPFFKAVSYILSIFETRVYIAMMATYVVPCFLLGYLYHCQLKKRIPVKHWIKWHPFTWGIRALIWQSGDRRWHSKKFGFAAWLAGPSALMAITISYAFRGHNLSILRMNVYNDYWYPWVSINSLWYAGVTVVTDHPMLGHELPSVNGLHSYHQLANMLVKNRSIAYLTWWDRATSIAQHGYMGKSDVCKDWRPIRRGELYEPPRFLRKPESRFVFWKENVLGWEVKRWGDDKVIRRLRLLQGESQLVTKIRQRLAKTWNRVDGSYHFTIQSISLVGNVFYVFMVGFISLLLEIGVWVGEVIWGKLVLAPKQKRLLQRLKGDLDAGGEVIRDESSRQSSAAGGDVTDLVAEAIALADEEQIKRGSSATSRKIESVVMVERIQGIEGERRGKSPRQEIVGRETEVQVDPASQRQQEEDRINVVDSLADDEMTDESVTETEMDTLEAGSDFEGHVSADDDDENGFGFTVKPRVSSPTLAIVSTTAYVHINGNAIGTMGDKKKNWQEQRAASECSQREDNSEKQDSF